MSERSLRLLLSLFVISLFAIIFFKNFSPFGLKSIYKFSFPEDKNYFNGLDELQPVSRLKQDSQSIYEVKYFDLSANKTKFDIILPPTPVNPKKVTISTKFKTEKETKLGILSERSKDYTYFTLYNPILEKINWSRINDGDLSLYQKNPRFKSIDEFKNSDLVSDKGTRNIATYLTHLEPKIQGLTAKDDSVEVNSTLRGQNTMYTYVQNSRIDMGFIKQDLNQYLGQDSLEIEVYKDEKLITTSRIEDDGVVENKSILGPEQSGRLNVALENGIYKIVLKADIDLLIKKISLNQKYLVFENIFLADNSEVYPGTETKESTVFSNVTDLNIYLPHEKMSQTINVDSNPVEIKDVNTKMNINSQLSEIVSESSRDTRISEIKVQKNDIGLSGNGLFSFTRESFFNPLSERTVTLTKNLNLIDVDYIIAKYSPVSDTDGWLYQVIEFDLSEEYFKDNKLSFVIEDSTPDSKFNQENWLWLKNLEITVQ